MRKAIHLFLILITTTACSWDRNDPSLPWFYPQPGAKLVLHQPLTIKAGSAALYFQHGKIRGSHSRFDPFCKIRLRNVRNTEQIIRPDTFIITSSGRHTELVAGLTGFYIPLEASATIHTRINVGSSDAPSDITEMIVMNLSSKTQPDVIRLSCGGAEDHPANAEPPTFTEITKALGKIMTIHPTANPQIAPQ